MKTHILKSTIALLLAATPLALAQDVKEEKKESAKVTAESNASGEVTVEIDVNGKKERKTFKLGNGQPFKWEIEDKDHKAGAAARVGKFLEKRIAGKKEKVTFLGVAAEPVGDEVRAQLPLQAGEGLAVRHVMPESPAGKAGVVEHDILTRLDDQILVSGDQLRALVKMRKPGDSVKLTFLRKGEKKEATVALTEHEVEVERDNVFRFPSPDGKIIIGENTKDKLETVEKRLKEMKDKLPGMIVDKKSFLIGPDGAVQKLYTEKLDEVVENVRKQLEKSQTTPEEREQVRKSVEEAIRSAREAFEKAEDLIKRKTEPKTEELKP